MRVNAGARIYAEIVGYGMTADAFHITMPDETGSGAIRVMQKALQDAGVGPEQLSVTSTLTALQLHTTISLRRMAIKTTFGEHAYKLAVSSTKSMTGHLLGAAGGIEGVFSTMAIHRNVSAADDQLRESGSGL